MVNIRLMEKKDIEGVMEQLLRLKHLNEEFDPLLKVSIGNEKEISEKLTKIIEDKDDHINLVAEEGNRVIGMIMSDIVFRIYYDPKYEARIREFYVMPEFRSKGIGMKLIEKLKEIAAQRNIKMVTAEFPSLNLLASNFYKSIDFKELIKIYSKIN
ncbi:MAG: acetyltransferase [Ferroplasma sp. Type II]|uniref:GNAT family N-acetyltransferase n=1 Tax=Ferroplasma sp. Type II TaxID=261388 RepID=UPI0003896229|nr:GNAT family N-acetyltransferase [Ferroplasma sp. Type II]EQB74115.1 MAG: acetyltransferase [Ferroplasma sp. Type II]